MSEGLKPCAFCGGDAVSGDYQGQAWVDCLTCPGHVSMRGAEADAIAAWNRRASGWVPVSERLPNADGRYWCQCAMPDIPECTTQEPVLFKLHTNRISGEWNLLAACIEDYEVTHWMPLPSTEGL